KLIVISSGLLSFLRADTVPGVRPARHLDAQGVDGRAGGEEQGPEVGAAERAVRRDFRSADDAEPRAIGREDPRAARARAEDAALGVHLYPVGHAVGLVGRHVGEDAAPDELAVRIDFEGMDVLRPPRVGYVEHALVR